MSRGFHRILEDDPAIRVVGEAGDRKETMRFVQELRPQVIVLDCALPVMTGIEATGWICERLRATGTLTLGMHSEERLAQQAMESGARGDIFKSAADLDLAAVVRPMARG